VHDLIRDVTISTTESVALPLADALRDYRAATGLGAELRISNGFLDLVRGEADIAAHLMPAPWVKLAGRRVADVAFAVYAARRYLDDSPFDLCGAEWVCLDAARAGHPQAQWEADIVPESRVALRAGSLHIALDSIVLGHAIGVLPCGVAARHHELVPVTGVIAELTRSLWLVTQPMLARAERIRGLLDFLHDDLERERPLIEGAGLTTDHRRRSSRP